MAEIKSEETSEKKSLNFIEQIVENDLKEGKNDGKVQTRFPPGTQRLSSHRTCQSHLPGFWYCRRTWRCLQLAFR